MSGMNRSIGLALILVGILGLGAGMGAGIGLSSQSTQSTTLVPQTYFVSVTSGLINPVGLPGFNLQASCNQGDVATGGGFQVNFATGTTRNDARRITVVNNQPFNVSGTQGWETTILNDGLGSSNRPTLTVTAICLIQHSPSDGGPPFGENAQGQGP